MPSRLRLVSVHSGDRRIIFFESLRLFVQVRARCLFRLYQTYIVVIIIILAYIYIHTIIMICHNNVILHHISLLHHVYCIIFYPDSNKISVGYHANRQWYSRIGRILYPLNECRYRLRYPKFCLILTSRTLEPPLPGNSLCPF